MKAIEDAAEKLTDALIKEGVSRDSKELPAAKQAAEKAISEAKTALNVDYRVSRQDLLDKPSVVNAYRYIGQQPYAALKLEAYRSYMGGEFKDKEKVDPYWLLLVISTAHQRTVELQEEPRIPSLWSAFSKPENREFVELLLSWHSAPDFPALTFVEVTTLVRLWGTSGDKSQAVIAATEAIVRDPSYRRPFLRVLCLAYAQTPAETPLPLLPLDDYLERLNTLKAVFTPEEDVETKAIDLPDGEWCERLCWFVSRVSDPLTKTGDKKEGEEKKAEVSPSWDEVVKVLQKLHTLRTVEGHSVARRLIVMLARLPAQSFITITQLEQLVSRANAKSSTSDKMSDAELFDWLQAQGAPYNTLSYPVLVRSTALPTVFDTSIKSLLSEYSSLLEEQKKQLTTLLERLWDASGSLGSSEEKELEERNKAIESCAKAFLQTLLNPKAVWRRRSHELISLLAEHPQLECYDFDFLQRLLTAAHSLAFVDSELSLFRTLLGTGKESPTKIVQLIRSQESFARVVELVCRSSNLNLNQVRRTLSLLRQYATCATQKDQVVLMGLFAEWIIRFFKAYPAATDATLILLEHALRGDNLVLFIQTANNLMELVKKIDLLGIEVEAKAGEVNLSLSKSKYVVSLCCGLAGEVDAKSCQAILAQCVHEEMPLPVVELMAISLGRKDSGEDILRFLSLSLKLYTEGQHDRNPPAELYPLQ